MKIRESTLLAILHLSGIKETKENLNLYELAQLQNSEIVWEGLCVPVTHIAFEKSYGDSDLGKVCPKISKTSHDSHVSISQNGPMEYLSLE